MKKYKWNVSITKFMRFMLNDGVGEGADLGDELTNYLMAEYACEDVVWDTPHEWSQIECIVYVDNVVFGRWFLQFETVKDLADFILGEGLKEFE